MDSTRYSKMAADLASEFDIASFHIALGEWRMAINEVFRQPRPDTHRQIAKEKILQYLDIQLERASKCAAPEADLLAMIVRRLIELRFWTEYVADEEKARAFVYEAGYRRSASLGSFQKGIPRRQTYRGSRFSRGQAG
jgi:hypothetical protein